MLFNNFLVQSALFRMAGRQSSAAPSTGTTRAERTSSIPSMLVKASATVPVSRPALSFPNQHNTKRNRFSGSGNLALKALVMANRAR